MKAQKKLTVGIAVAIVAVLVASQSVNPAAVKEKATQEQIKIKPQPYSNEEVELLMEANHWTRQKAEEVLDLANKAAESSR